jgi:hypothetical protein
MREIPPPTQVDATLLMPTRFSLGFMRRWTIGIDRRAHGILSAQRRGIRACGRWWQHRFIDTGKALAFGYSMNQMGAGILLNPAARHSSTRHRAWVAAPTHQVSG